MMDQTEPQVIKPVIKPKRKYTRRKLRLVPRSAEPASRPAGELAGLSITDCCKACNPTNCVISGAGYCGSPAKGGQIDRNNPAAVERFRRAEKMLNIKRAEDRYAQR